MVFERPTEEEVARRETYVRGNTRPRQLYDPYTWPYPYKSGACAGGLTVVSLIVHNLWYKRPLYFSILPRLAVIGTITAVGFALGSLREHHYRTRDAVLDHYISLHPDDFDFFKDFSGRQYSAVLLPWYPHRAQQRYHD